MRSIPLWRLDLRRPPPLLDLLRDRADTTQDRSTRPLRSQPCDRKLWRECIPCPPRPPHATRPPRRRGASIGYSRQAPASPEKKARDRVREFSGHSRRPPRPRAAEILRREKHGSFLQAFVRLQRRRRDSQKQPAAAAVSPSGAGLQYLRILQSSARDSWERS